MMIVVSSLLFALAAIAMIVAVWMTRKLHGHLKEFHPTVWTKLGFPRSSIYPKPTDEGELSIAQFKLARFVKSQDRFNLQDNILNFLVAAKRIAMILVLVFFFSGLAVLYVGGYLN